MSRDLLIGNGSLVIDFDGAYRLADVYYPHAGMENHAGDPSRFGIFLDGVCSWVDGEGWQRTLTYLRETNVTDVTLTNNELGIRLRCHDAVDAESNIYVRKIVVRNQRGDARRVRLFFHHGLELSGSRSADTAIYDPDSGGVIHYKAKRYFLANAGTESRTGVDDYACGQASEPSWRDAEDGVLSRSAIQQGAVDSTMAIDLDLDPFATETAYYWICAGTRYSDVRALDQQVRDETPGRIIARTASIWYTWVHKSGEDVTDLPEEIADLYRRSLLIVQAHCDRGGGIIASADAEIALEHNDHYAYVWPRDAAFTADAMDRCGFHQTARRFLQFAHDTISNEGYFLHKYTPDGSLASSWTAWVRNGRKQLPIQEDETALVLWLLARHYDRTRDLDFIRAVYKRLVVQPAEFLVAYRDAATNLPLPSHDIWEERLGVFTFTASAVCAALNAAAQLANLFNEQERRARYLRVATEIRDAMVQHLWLEDEARFARGLVLRDDDSLELDPTVDASTFATFYLDVFAADTAMVESTIRAMREKLWVPTEIGGLARYENDAYQKRRATDVPVPGNPWIICTLWLAEHAIARATRPAELRPALDLLRWVRARARPSLVLPEQVHPHTGAPLSVAPFSWSHAQTISVVRGYLDALRVVRPGSAENGARTAPEEPPANSVDNVGPFS